MNENNLLNQIEIISTDNEILPIDQCAKQLDLFIQASNILREKKARLELTIIKQMKATNATKLPFKDIHGADQVYTLTEGAMKPSSIAEKAWKEAGFEPAEIGNYEFKPSWTKAKEVKKFGGSKAELIEMLFQRDVERLKK